MKAKKGFALATTLVVMVLVLALSNLLLILATSSNTFAKSQTTVFEKNQQIYQFTQNFANLNLTDFKSLYSDYTEENLENTTKLSDFNSKYCFVIIVVETLETLVVKNYEQTTTFATIQKENGLITAWEIQN